MSNEDYTENRNRVNNLIGMRFGRWNVISRSYNNKHGKAVWLCCCDCGNESLVVGSSLLNGRSTGCKNHGHIKHGHSPMFGKKSRTYYAWSSMKKRCKVNSCDSKNYFHRGISVCDRWMKFKNFLEDMGECPNGLELDRIDNNKGYEPGNCRWVDEITQRRNQRNFKHYDLNGLSMSLIDWSKKTGITYNTLIKRMCRSKWPFEKAVLTPVKRAA